MAIPVHAAAGTALEGSGSAISLAAPAGVDAGDLVAAWFYLDGVDTTISVYPDDWTEAPGSPVTVNTGFTGSHVQHVVWHRAAGPESGPYVFTLSGSTYRAAQAHRFTGVKAAGTPWDVFASDVALTSQAETPPLSITTAGDDELVLWSATDWGGGPWTPPAGFTEHQDFVTGLVTMASKDQAVAGSTGSVTGTSAVAQKQTAWLSALLPVSEAGGNGAMNLVDVMDEIAASMGTIDGLRVWPYPPGSVTAPAAIVSYPERIAFDLAYGRGMDRWTLPVVLVVGKPTDRVSRRDLSGYTDITGIRSIKNAIEGDGTHTAFDEVQVTSVEFDVVEIGGVEHMAAIFELDIAGSGA